VVFQDTDTVSGYTAGSGLAAAQTFLNYLETLDILSRQSIPVFHREAWFPMLIRKSEQNRAVPNQILVDQTPDIVIGAQPGDSAYAIGQVFDIGGLAAEEGTVSYPITATGFNDGVDKICDQIGRPLVTLVKNVDYSIVENTVIFRADKDPFNDTVFPRRVVRLDDGSNDEEILLWGTDVLVDREYIFDHWGQPIDFPGSSDEIYKGATNALYDLRFTGATRALVRAAAGALLGVATVRNLEEVVEEVFTNADGTKVVATDLEVYRFGSNEEIREGIVPGAEVTIGEFLTNTVKVYGRLNPDKFLISNGRTLDEFVEDVPQLYLPKGIIGGRAGFVVSWADTDITFHGFDTNGNPKLRFEMGGSPEDLNNFWTDIWFRAQRDNVNLATVFADFLSPGPYNIIGQVAGIINPLRFYMKEFLSTNAHILVVDVAALPDYITNVDVLTPLSGALPAHTVLLVVINQTVDGESFDLGSEAGDSFATIAFGKALKDEVEFGPPSLDQMTFDDSPVLTRFVKV
jgi:hypothetical protein